MKNIINWKVFVILWLAAVVSTLAVLPYALELQSSVLSQLDLPIPLPILILLQTVQSAVIFALLIFGGLFFAHRVHLELPILTALTQRESITNKLRAILPISIVLGILAGLLIIGLEVLVFKPALAAQLPDTTQTQPAAWKGFLASFYGGIAEEIQLRLFVMSFLAWLGSFLAKTLDGKPAPLVYWSANILAAILFGLAHLPATASIMALTPLVVTRAVLLNGLGGVIFGWLFWKRGLEAAMISHFTTDLILHVLFAL